LGAEFRLIGPEGDIATRSAIIASVKERHGAALDGEAPERIDNETVEPRFKGDGGCLLTYEEHQRTAGSWWGRRSSALFEAAPAAPGGVRWRHLHETWLPK